MRIALALLTILCLGGCQHIMARQFDRARVLDTANREAERRHIHVKNLEASEIVDAGKAWEVRLGPQCHQGCIGGPVVVWVSKLSGRATDFAVFE